KGVMEWEFDDGGRLAAGHRRKVGGCVVRALAIATKYDYDYVYGVVARSAKGFYMGGNARDGVSKRVTKAILLKSGWEGTVLSAVLEEGELPAGQLIVELVRKPGVYHVAAIVDGVVRDTIDPRKYMIECYWRPPSAGSTTER